MPWFAAHVIMNFKRKDGSQDSFTVWENVHVIEAADADGAWVRAEALGREAEGDDGGTLREVDATGAEHPAEQRFAGVRKIVTVAHVGDDARIASGDEVTFSELTVDTEEAVHRLARGESVPVVYTER